MARWFARTKVISNDLGAGKLSNDSFDRYLLHGTESRQVAILAVKHGTTVA